MLKYLPLIALLFAGQVSAELYCYELGDQTICEDGHVEYYCYELGDATICEEM